MKDRVSTKILDNGATRYGVYDETGKLLRYEYIKLEDEPDEEGTILNKANLLTDEVARKVGLRTADPTPNDMFNVLANVGNLHVWERVQTYSEEVPAGYTLGEKESTKICEGGYSSNGRIIAYTGTEISVDKGGNVTLGGTTDTVDDSLYGFVGQTNLRGKYVRFKPHITGSSPESQVFVSGVFYVPNDANCTFLDGSTSKATSSTYGLIIDKLQAVKAYPAIPAGTTTDYLTSTDRNAYTDGTVGNTTITYLGQLGGRARIETGSYVGTGTYGSSNPNTLTFEFEPKVVIFDSPDAPMMPPVYIEGVSTFGAFEAEDTNYSTEVQVVASGKTISWYNASSYYYQGNVSGATYRYIAIG